MIKIITENITENITSQNQWKYHVSKSTKISFVENATIVTIENILLILCMIVCENYEVSLKQ